MQTQTVKIVVTGPFNAGKTELIRSVSEIEVVNTEKKVTSESEKVKNSNHAHPKPIGLQKELILATSNENDIVLDPAAGTFSVMNAAIATNRRFIGCDISYGELYGIN